jgi:type I restriction enzyme, S subunit
MKVQAGFKQTEYGTIPEDWGLMELRNIAKYRRGSFPQPYGLSKWYDDVLGNPFIQVVDVDDNMKLKPETKKRLSKEAEKMSVFARKGSVILSLNGSVGRVALTQYDGFIDRTLLIFENFFIPIDKYYFIYSVSAVFREEEKKAPGAILKTITKEHLSNFLLPLPSFDEQAAIGEALSDTDAFIEALEQLLTKKSQIKQGTMQELLTGKRRLPEFSEEWVIRKLGEITEIVSGGTPSTSIDEYWNGEINWCIPTDITKAPGKYLVSTEKRITEKGLKNSSANLLPKGTLLLCSRATIGDVRIATGVICTNQGFKSLICSNQIYNEYLYYVLLTIKPILIEKAIGSTFLEITKKEISSIEIRTPPIPEQQAIAEIFNDMDAEIATLEDKLTKARHIKQGMLQELLTGRIRLV